MLAATVLLALVALAPGPQHPVTVLENRVGDLLFVFPAARVAPPVAVVAKTSRSSTSSTGADRTDMARTLGEIARAGGRVAALDYIYDLPKARKTHGLRPP